MNDEFGILLYAFVNIDVLKNIWKRISTTGRAGIPWGEYLT